MLTDFVPGDDPSITDEQSSAGVRKHFQAKSSLEKICWRSNLQTSADKLGRELELLDEGDDVPHVTDVLSQT